MKNFLKKIVWIGLMLLPLTVFSQLFTEVQKIVTTDRQVYSKFGNDASIYGDYAVISAYQYNSSDNAVYIYQKNSSGQWQEIQKIVSPETRPFNAFGYSVDIFEDYIIVGDWVYYQRPGPIILTGAAYIYKKGNDNTWQLQQQLLASDGIHNDNFGYAVSIFEKTCIVGASTLNLTVGAVYVFEQDVSGAWVEVDKLSPTNSPGNDSFFGSFIDLENNTLVVSAPEEDFDESGNNWVQDAGLVYVYEKNSMGIWEEVQRISDFDRVLNGQFGASLDLEDGELIIGSGSKNSFLGNTYSQTSSAYMYKKNNAGIWEFTQKLTPPNPGNPYGFSNSVSLSGDYAVVTAIDEQMDNDGNSLDRYSGAAYIYQRQPDGLWSQTQRVVSSDLSSRDYFGRFATLDGNSLIIGAFQEDEDENGQNTLESSGSVYVFEVCLTVRDTISQTTCNSFQWQGNMYTQSGMYEFITMASTGCDSIITLNLSILPRDTTELSFSTCYPYQWNGETYTQSGNYSLTQANQYGCDSTTNLQLTIHPSYENSLSLSACTEVEYQNNIYTTSGMYQVPLQSVFGCDSIIHLDVKLNAQSIEETQSVCDSFYWPQSQQQYNVSGIYQEVFTNQSGCDSSYQLTLEILPSYHQTEAREVCETYTWPTNQETYTQSGLYTVQRQTQQGCDSIQTLNLTIYEGFRKRDTIVADSSYTWPVNNTTYETSGTYEAGYTNIEGCDSIHYLVLRIESTYTIQFPNIITGGTNVHPFKGYSNHDHVIIKELSIFDRMASRVYHIENVRINDPDYGWNGTFRDMEVVPGVYVWMAEVVLPDGNIKRMAGDVTVIR